MVYQEQGCSVRTSTYKAQPQRLQSKGGNCFFIFKKKIGRAKGKSHGSACGIGFGPGFNRKLVLEGKVKRVPEVCLANRLQSEKEAASFPSHRNKS